MVVDISEINLENLYMYQPNYRKKQKKTGLTKKEYQHKYYMEVTKIKRNKLSDKQKLIEKLEEDVKSNNKSMTDVLNYTNMVKATRVLYAQEILNFISE